MGMGPIRQRSNGRRHVYRNLKPRQAPINTTGKVQPTPENGQQKYRKPGRVLERGGGVRRRHCGGII